MKLLIRQLENGLINSLLTNNYNMESTFIRSIKYTEVKDSNEVYHANKDYISASGLKKIKKSPLHFMTEEKKETEALSFGSAYHKYILEKELFDQEYFVFDETFILDVLRGEGSLKPRGTNKYKEWYEKEMQAAEGKVMIDQPTFEIIKSMQERLWKHRYVRSLFSNGEAEKSFYCEVETEVGILKIKIRVDYHKKKHRIITDLKTCQDASMGEFPKNAASYDYHIQAALYSDIMKAITGEEWPFFFVAQEKTKPFAFNIFESSPQFINQGRYEYEQLLRLYHFCKENNYWPGYQVFCENKFGIIELKLPAWSINEINFYNHLNK